MNRKEKLLEKIEELKAEVEMIDNEKPWPDSFEKARNESPFWGFEIMGERYFISMVGNSEGIAIQPEGFWSQRTYMDRYWKKEDGYLDDQHYSFHKFNSAKDLYQWLLEGEES